MKQSPVEGESTTGRTRRYQRAKEALATTLAQEATQSFEAPANRGVRTRVKTNTDTQSGAPRPGMLTAGIRPGAELKSNEMGGIAADDPHLEMREPEEFAGKRSALGASEMRARAPGLGAVPGDASARASIRRETRLEFACEERTALAQAGFARIEAQMPGPSPETTRVPLRRDPLATETRYLGRPKNAPGRGHAGAGTGEHAQWGWIAAMVLAILALGMSVYVAFGR